MGRVNWQGANFASTGPRSIERGRPAEISQQTQMEPASTGPRSIERGRNPKTPNQTRQLPASTGPRSIERGRQTFSTHPLRQVEQLQRGRAQLSAEGCRQRPPGGAGGSASTGPRSIERGRVRVPDVVMLLAVLQRGRAQLSAEGKPLTPEEKAMIQLQRGRAQLSAEGWRRTSPPEHQPSASTGPRSIERGRRVVTIDKAISEQRFNGAALN